MTEIPISSDVTNVESCNKDFLEALERLSCLAYKSLMFDLFKVQWLCNLTFDLGSGNFFYKDLEPTCVYSPSFNLGLQWEQQLYRSKCSSMYTFFVFMLMKWNGIIVAGVSTHV